MLGWDGRVAGTEVEWPTTWEGARAEVERRRSVYRQAPYTDAEVVRWNLFRAVDDSNAVTATTRRVDKLITYVCGVDAAAIATDGLTVEARTAGGTSAVDPIEAADTEDARLVWSRSGVSRQVAAWALAYCVDGDAVWEVQLRPDGARIVWHDVRDVQVWRDLDGSISMARIGFDYVPAPDPEDLLGDATPPERRHYVRVLTRTEVITQDGDSPPVRVPHSLGVVPLVRARYGEIPGAVVVGAWAGLGLEASVAMLDSATCQIQTVGTRHSNPLLKIIGARLAEGSDPSVVGAAVSLPIGGDVAWVEAALEGVRALVEARASLRESVERMCPELLFVDAGASASGTALSYRASAFSAKMLPIRESFYAALADATAMAMAWQSDTDARVASEARRLIGTGAIVVSGGSVLPSDSAAEVALLTSLVESAGITRTDYIAGLQRLGMLSTDDPAAYGEQASADSDAQAARGALAAERMGAALAGLGA